MPLLWRDQVIGWGNLSVSSGALVSDVGFVNASPKDKAFRVALDEELHRMAVFLNLNET